MWIMVVFKCEYCGDLFECDFKRCLHCKTEHVPTKIQVYKNKRED